MIDRRKIKYFVITLTWLFAIAFLPLQAYRHNHAVGWDLDVYRRTVLSLRAGHDPYADGVARQILIRDHPERRDSLTPAFTYPYSPITLPLVRWIARFPMSLSGAIYILFCAAGIILPIYVAIQIAEPSERQVTLLLAPLALFMPGLIFGDVIVSGNIAFPIYALVFPSALLGWRRNRWLCFYITVLLASCVKAPLLVLLAIPILSARRQWIPTGITAGIGVGIFAIQPHIWPALFKTYLTAVELQFSLNRDFGASPAGVLAKALFDSVPYRTTLTVFYLVYAIPVALSLLYLRRRFMAGRFSLRQWIPVLIIGVTLLNPRIMEYDVAPITILMGLAAWRIARRGNSNIRAALLVYIPFSILNCWALLLWRSLECGTLVILFILSVRYLLTEPHNPEFIPSTVLSS